MKKNVLMWTAAALVLAVMGCSMEEDEDPNAGLQEQRELRDGLAASIAWLNGNAQSDSTYTIVLSADETSASITLDGNTVKGASDRSVERVTVILTGEEQERTIQLELPDGETYGGLLYVSVPVTRFVLDENITLKGVENTNSALVHVDSSDFEMREGAKITGGGGGGVGVINGTFIMTGGEIYGNAGHGVYASDTFTMSGGEIYSNTADSSGGGVYVDIFTMSGGKIYGNTASDGSGGGVYASSTFTMTGGEIYGNTANGLLGDIFSTGDGGGGVRVRGVFTKTGGIIYGYSAENPLSNRMKNKNTNVLFSNRGHAVYVTDSGSPKRCETTVGESHNLDSTKSRSEGGGWDV